MRVIFEKRKSFSKRSLVIVPIVSFLISLLLGTFLLLILGVDPIETYGVMFSGAFASWIDFSDTLVKSIPLILAGTGIIVAFKMKFWNIGAEGQLIFGGIFASGAALFLPSVIPHMMVIPVAILMGMIGGAFWAFIPAVLKAYLKVDETLTTLMLNYVAIYFASYLYFGPWKEEGSGYRGTREFDESTWLPILDGNLHVGIIFAILIAFVIWFLLAKTKWGFELNILGENPNNARYIGINIKRKIISAMVISGSLSGLAGTFQVLGVMHRLEDGLVMNYGYTAIIVAWMAQLNAIAAIFVAILLAGLIVGGELVQMFIGLPASVSDVLQGLILFPLLAGALFTEYKLKIIRK